MQWPRLTDFKLVTKTEVGVVRRCSECGKRNLLVSYELREGDTVHKVVCSMECAKEFDARFWESRAVESEIRKGIAE